MQNLATLQHELSSLHNKWTTNCWKMLEVELQLPFSLSWYPSPQDSSQLELADLKNYSILQQNLPNPQLLPCTEPTTCHRFLEIFGYSGGGRRGFVLWPALCQPWKLRDMDVTLRIQLDALGFNPKLKESKFGRICRATWMHVPPESLAWSWLCQFHTHPLYEAITKIHNR